MMLAHYQGGLLCGSLSKTVDTPVNGRPSLFRIDSVHQMETSLSHAMIVFSLTKDVAVINLKGIF
jgi:hypothetical protein